MTNEERKDNKKTGRAILTFMGLGYVVGSAVEILFKVIRMANTGKYK